MTETINNKIIFYLIVSVMVFLINFGINSNLGINSPQYNYTDELSNQLQVYEELNGSESLTTYGTIKESKSLFTTLKQTVSFNITSDTMPFTLAIILIVLFELIPALIIGGAIADWIRGR